MRSEQLQLTSESILQFSEDIFPEIVKVRRQLHRNPELGFEEYKTTEFIRHYVRNLGLTIQSGFGPTGVVAILQGFDPGPCILLRADIDALPIKENTSVEFASERSGIMHACGHDVHTAMLLGVAKGLTEHREHIRGTVKFVFQPAEEMKGGGRVMVESGVLQNPVVDRTFAFHVWPDLPTGVFGLREGTLMASMDTFDVKIHGRKAHGAEPHEGIDAVTAAAELVQNLQKIVSREVAPVDSAVVTVGAISGGETYNIIADNVSLMGSVRTLREQTRTDIEQAIYRIVEGTSSGTRTTIDLDYERRYPVTVNDGTSVRYAEECIKDLYGTSAIQSLDEPSLASEDFAFFLEQVPGCMIFLGVGGDKPGQMALHTETFMPDEKAMKWGISLMIRLAIGSDS